MSEVSKRSTIYFDPQLHAALRLKAAHSNRSVSDIVNDAVRSALAEDQEDPRPLGSEKLSRRERYRIRQGIYRIIYELVDDHLIVTVVKVGHRPDVYRHP